MANEEWRPGSFTKNFSWGTPDLGLKRLHEMIQIGFEGTLEDVPRAIFRNRVQNSGRPDYVALNFFLYNKIIDHVDHVVVDELVFQALTSDHSKRFDRLALFAFNFSYVGRWSGAEPFQQRPALWALHYVKERVAKDFNWDTSINGLALERVRGSAEALFKAGKAFKTYKQDKGGSKNQVLPDFIIGATADAANVPLMTANASDYEGYFPDLQIIAPP